MYSKYSVVHVLFTICTDKDLFISMRADRYCILSGKKILIM